MKVAVYLNHYNKKHAEIAECFALGISRYADVALSDVREYVKADVAVIFGLVKNSYPATHPKKKIIASHGAKSLLVIESGFMCRPHYYAIGWNGIHGDANFALNRNYTNDRFNQLGIELSPWREATEVKNVLVCGQVPWDTNVQHFDYLAWVKDTIYTLRAQGYKVRFRPHPRMDASIYGVPKKLIDNREKLSKALDWADCVVVYNSTSAVDALIAGVPIITIGKNAIARPLACQKLDPSSVIRPDRTGFFNALAYTQWTLPEMASGLPWLHLNGQNVDDLPLIR